MKSSLCELDELGEPSPSLPVGCDQKKSKVTVGRYLLQDPRYQCIGPPTRLLMNHGPKSEDWEWDILIRIAEC